MTDISGFGLRVIIKASRTFPSGITITQFADDADPLDNPSIDIATVARGLNGDLVGWSSAVPIALVLNVIPNTDDDRDLETLAQANMVGRGRRPARDVITATVMYPDGSSRTLVRGMFTTAVLAPGIASSGRQKTRPYGMAFEDITRN